MKKLFLFTLAVASLSISSFAQDISKNAIGLRLGDSRGLGAEISYQRAILEKNRLELDFGWRNGKDYNGVKAVGLFQWVKPIEGSFNWYFGAGAGFSAYQFDGNWNGNGNNNNNDYKDSFVFLAGDVGIEYKFDFPLLLSLDVRPELGLGNDRYDNNDLDFDVGVGVRYTF